MLKREYCVNKLLFYVVFLALNLFYPKAVMAGFFDELKENANKVKESVVQIKKNIPAKEKETQKPKPDQNVLAAQKALNKLGYNVGLADGYMGNNTAKAIIQFQKAEGLPETGQVDALLLTRLVKAQARPSSVVSSPSKPSAVPSQLPDNSTGTQASNQSSNVQSQITPSNTNSSRTDVAMPSVFQVGDGVFSGSVVESFPLLPDSLNLDNYRQCMGGFTDIGFTDIMNCQCVDIVIDMFSAKGHPDANKLPQACRINITGLEARVEEIIAHSADLSGAKSQRDAGHMDEKTYRAYKNCLSDLSLSRLFKKRTLGKFELSKLRNSLSNKERNEPYSCMGIMMPSLSRGPRGHKQPPDARVKFSSFFSQWEENPNNDPNYSLKLHRVVKPIYDSWMKNLPNKKVEILGLYLGQPMAEVVEKYPLSAWKNASKNLPYLGFGDNHATSNVLRSAYAPNKNMRNNWGTAEIAGELNISQEKANLLSRFYSLYEQEDLQVKRRYFQAFGILSRVSAPNSNTKIITANIEELKLPEFSGAGITSIKLSFNVLDRLVDFSLDREIDGLVDLDGLLAKHEEKFGKMSPTRDGNVGWWTFDLGKNAAGLLRMEHASGKTLLRYNFRLKDDGTLYTQPIQSIIEPLMKEYLAQKESTVSSGADIEI